MRFVLDNLTLIMVVFLLVGMFTRYRSEIVLLSVAGIVAIFGLATGEIYIGHIIVLPKIVLLDYLVKPNVLAVFALVFLLDMAKRMSPGRWPSIADKFIDLVRPLQCLLIAPIILFYLSDPRHFDWRYVLFTLLVTLALSATLKQLNHFNVQKIAAFASSQPDRQLPFRSLLKVFMLLVSITVYLQVLQRVNGQHYLLGAVRGLPIDAGWVVMAITSAAVMLSVWIGWFRTLLVVNPFIAPAAFVVAQSGHSPTEAAAFWISLIVGLALQIVVLLQTRRESGLQSFQ